MQVKSRSIVSNGSDDERKMIAEKNLKIELKIA